jgi:hypothetical protein
LCGFCVADGFRYRLLPLLLLPVVVIVVVAVVVADVAVRAQLPTWWCGALCSVRPRGRQSCNGGKRVTGGNSLAKRVSIFSEEDPNKKEEVTDAFYELVSLLAAQDVDVDCMPVPNWVVTGV